MNSAPYNLCKKVADADRATPESGDFGYSATSDVPGFISVSTFKESSTEIWEFNLELSLMHIICSKQISRLLSLLDLLKFVIWNCLLYIDLTYA